MRRSLYDDPPQKLDWFEFWLVVIAGVVVGLGIAAWLAHSIGSEMGRALGM